MSSSEWPSPSKYSTAIQHSSNYFDDPDLRSNSVKTSRLGLPAVRKTSIWDKLKKSSDSEVRRLTTALEDSCRDPVPAIPTLEEPIQDTPPASRPVAPKPVSQPAPSPSPPISPISLVCLVCNQAHSADQIYCWSCGHQISENKLCPHCHQATPASPIAKFCAMCGGRL